MIKLIEIEEIGSVTEVFKSVIEDMNTKGINQWDSVYPNEEVLCKDIQNKEAYGYYADNEMIGYVSINDKYSEEYKTVEWQYFDNKPFIIHRLAVKSNFQGQGIAKKLIYFAENQAKTQGYKTIRLDAFSQNPNALNLYKKLNYNYVGDVLFRKGLFHCFEKRIND